MQPHTDTTPTTWWQLKIPVPVDLAEDAGACLIEAGALGTVTLEGGPQTHILACYSHDAPADTLLSDAIAALSEIGLSVSASSVALSQQNDGAWAERWKQYFKPLKVGRRLWIVPTWESQFLSPTGSIVLQMDPGSAFGTGQHGTTALCLKAIELYFEGLSTEACRKTRLLDVGCGTGILGLAAAKLGAGQVLGIDIDPAAVSATQHNAVHNHVAERLKGELTPLSEVPGTYHFIVANISPVTLLIGMAPLLVRRLAPKGQLVLAGMLREQADEVVTQFLKAGERMGVTLRHEKAWTHGEWILLQFLL